MSRFLELIKEYLTEVDHFYKDDPIQAHTHFVRSKSDCKCTVCNAVEYALKNQWSK